MKQDKTGVKYVEMTCKCTKTRPVHIWLREGLDSRYFVGECPKCDKRYITRVKGD